MGAHFADTGGATPSVAATLDILSAEIELAGARCIYLDRVIGQALDSLPDGDRARLTDGLHAVDLLAQHLTSLSAFARNMSLTVSEDYAAPVGSALAEITLGDLAGRMAAALGLPDPLDDDANKPASGDLDLF
jgi:hypothetical protein